MAIQHLSAASQATAIYDMAERIVSQDVRYCVSGLISALMAHAYDHADPVLNEDDATLLAHRAPDVDDYRDLAPERVTVLQVEEQGGKWEWMGPNADMVYTDDGGEYFDTEIEAWRSAFDTNDWDVPAGSEIYEHWLVTNDLARRLEELGESVTHDVVGMTVWGRATTGQAISMDAVIQRIARNILEA